MNMILTIEKDRMIYININHTTFSLLTVNLMWMCEIAKKSFTCIAVAKEAWFGVELVAHLTVSIVSPPKGFDPLSVSIAALASWLRSKCMKPTPLDSPKGFQTVGNININNQLESEITCLLVKENVHINDATERTKDRFQFRFCYGFWKATNIQIGTFDWAIGGAGNGHL